MCALQSEIAQVNRALDARRNSIRADHTAFKQLTQPVPSSLGHPGLIRGGVLNFNPETSGLTLT